MKLRNPNISSAIVQIHWFVICINYGVSGYYFQPCPSGDMHQSDSQNISTDYVNFAIRNRQPKGKAIHYGGDSPGTFNIDIACDNRRHRLPQNMSIALKHQGSDSIWIWVTSIGIEETRRLSHQRVIVGLSQSAPAVGWGGPLHVWLASVNWIGGASCLYKSYRYGARGMHYHMLLRPYRQICCTYNSEQWRILNGCCVTKASVKHVLTARRQVVTESVG